MHTLLERDREHGDRPQFSIPSVINVSASSLRRARHRGYRGRVQRLGRQHQRHSVRSARVRLHDARIILAAWGLTEKDITAEYLKANQAGDKIRDGGLDAFFFVGTYPTSAISELASAGGGVDLVPVTGPEVEKMLKQYGFFAPSM